MRKFLVFSLLYLLASYGMFADDEIDRIMEREVGALESEIGMPLVISLGNFLYEETKMGSSFSHYLEEKLSVALLKTGGFELFAREKLEEILEAIELSMNDLFDSKTAVRIGSLKGVQALAYGKYYDSGDAVRVFLEIVLVETGSLLSKREFAIPKGAIPESISIRPANYDNALYVLDQLYEVSNTDSGELGVKTWITRGDGSTYRDGEEMVIHFYANRDCYIKLYHIDVNKNIQLIFPNRYYQDNFIRANRIYRIPDARYPFKFVLGSPYGTEFIKVIASTLQFSDIEDSFSNLGPASREIVTRGLSVKQREELVTESILSYTIIE